MKSCSQHGVQTASAYIEGDQVANKSINVLFQSFHVQFLNFIFDLKFNVTKQY